MSLYLRSVPQKLEYRIGNFIITSQDSFENFFIDQNQISFNFVIGEIENLIDCLEDIKGCYEASHPQEQK